ncbi:putative hydrolase of the HAD superfamily [Bosea psychrotolerans]|uniref:Putative hydrolase of the HAD superfamily n=1 Tax=Bosea psychrotolerans TaxID=1871628 RepID=A0A2S4LTZ4_9HYPH|nr:putative hydrolase of the HAD superfamily [Bosea psychrotolerans]
MRRALLVDVDGVLVRGRPGDGRPWTSELRQDLGLDPDLLHQHFFAKHWPDIVIGRAALEEKLAPVLAEIAPHLTYQDFTAYWFANDARLDVELLAALDLLRSSGITIALATNQEHVRARHLIGSLGLSRHIDDIFYSAAIGARKPEPAFFRAVQDKLGLKGQALLLLDDSFENVEAARRLGWQAIHWAYGSRLDREMARLIGAGNLR